MILSSIFPLDPFGLSPAQYAAAAEWLSFIVLLVTLIVIGKQLSVAARTRFDQTRPYVVPSLELQGMLGVIRVRNLGATAARNVYARFEGAAPTGIQATIDWTGRGLWGGEGLRSMPPGHHLDFVLDVLPKRFEAGDVDMSWSVAIEYEDMHGRSIGPETYVLDLIPYGDALVSEDATESIAKELEKLRKRVDKWSHIGGGLRVHSIDEDKRSAISQRPLNLHYARQTLRDKGLLAAGRFLFDRWAERKGFHDPWGEGQLPKPKSRRQRRSDGPGASKEE